MTCFGASPATLGSSEALDPMRPTEHRTVTFPLRLPSRWRTTGGRGVSDMVAMVLLVASVMVLAAILYVLLTGLTHGPGGVPLGSDFAWGKAHNASGSISTGCPAVGAPIAHYCYSIEVAQAGGGITDVAIALALQNPGGTSAGWPVGGVVISLVSPTNATALATYDVTTNTWTGVAGFGGTLASGQSIVVYTVTAGVGLFGDSLLAIGSGGFSGTVQSEPFS